MDTNGDDCNGKVPLTNRDNVPSTSNGKNPDNNANLTIDESKGAIPKIKFTKDSVVKKTNNNLGELQGFKNDLLKRNGYTHKTTGNYRNHIYNDSDSDDNEPATASKDNLKKPIGFQPLNIPIDDELLSPLLPLPNHLSNGRNYLDLEQNTGNNSREPNDDSSSDDNELLSISDDGCIYTYKGDNVADLPSSFFNLEIPQLDENPGDNRDENSSPEMDFLEMDFDPGPSGDADSDSISNTEIENAANLPLDPKSEIIQEEEEDGHNNVDELVEEKEPVACCSKYEPITTATTTTTITTTVVTTQETKFVPKNDIKMPWSCNLSERTRSSKHLRSIKRHHSCKGELLSPNEFIINGDISITNYHNLTNKIYDDKPAISCDDKVMIWSEKEACLKQITQIGPSACGATAVLNVLNALRLPIPTVERVQECIQTRLRANTSPLKEYLLSRSVAGCNHRDIIKALYKLSDQRIYARFFAMYPERIINLQKWLSYWIKNGAIPIATINLQKCDGTIPDSWHHQMVFGVGAKGIYLVNPLECVDPSQLWPQLSSESVLLIKMDDVINRYNPKTDLNELNTIDDVRWKQLNVVGQVARVIRESRRYPRSDHVNISHIKIPADYKAGITLAIDKNSPAFNLLRQCPELPLLNPEDASASAL